MLMIKIIKQKLDLSPTLLKKIDWAKNYITSNLIIENGYLIRLEPTNIAYVEPHKVTIHNFTFLFFNGNDYFYINNLNNKYKLSELDSYFRNAK